LQNFPTKLALTDFQKTSSLKKYVIPIADFVDPSGLSLSYSSGNDTPRPRKHVQKFLRAETKVDIGKVIPSETELGKFRQRLDISARARKLRPI
jgi:hypothetical protein